MNLTSTIQLSVLDEIQDPVCSYLNYFYLFLKLYSRIFNYAFVSLIVFVTHTASSHFLLNFINSYTLALFLICSHQFLFVCLIGWLVIVFFFFLTLGSPDIFQGMDYT